MNCHFMVYVRIVLTTLVTITCLLGDNFVELTQHPILKALADNATHATIGALTGIAFVVQFYDNISNMFGWLLIFVCFVVSSMIDVDHFIEARSWNLEDATNLLRRPFLHCSSIILMLVAMYLCAACLNYLKLSLLIGAVLCAFVTHHTRDAVRRGYWLCPFGHTERVSYSFYMFFTILTPYILSWLHKICRSGTMQYYVGQYIKLDNGYRPGSGSGSGSNADYRYMTV